MRFPTAKRVQSSEFRVQSWKNGFTLIELLIAISIVVILSAVGAVTYSTSQKTGRISKRVQDLQAISSAIELYKISTGHYPVLPSWGCVGNIPSLSPTYMKVIPADPLGLGNASDLANCYQYQSDTIGNEYKVRTNSLIYSSSCSVGAEMCSTDFEQQPGLVDPTKDATSDCIVTPSPGPIKGWAIYSSNGNCAAIVGSCTVQNSCGF